MDCLHALALNDEEILGLAFEEEKVVLPEPKRAHLKQCEICQQRVNRYKKVNQSLISHLYRKECPDGTKLSLYCADLLPDEERVHIAAHILDCSLCTAEVVSTRRFMRDVPFDDLGPISTYMQTIRRIFGVLVRQQAQLVLRDGNVGKAWPRQYHIESIDLSLHLPRATNGDYMLVGILTSADESVSVDAFEGARAELFAGTYAERTTKTPLRRVMVDDLGNIVFSSVPAGNYFLLIHLPGRELVIEQITIE